jgi:hypothetical protein
VPIWVSLRSGSPRKKVLSSVAMRRAAWSARSAGAAAEHQQEAVGAGDQHIVGRDAAGDEMMGDLADAVALFGPAGAIALADIGDADELELGDVQRAPAVGETADALGQVKAACAVSVCVHPCHFGSLLPSPWGKPCQDRVAEGLNALRESLRLMRG